MGMRQYPFYSPIVLTDQNFLLYGGRTGTSTDAQRQVAYLLAEEQMTEYLGAFLIPTIITGTHFWRGSNPIELDYGYVREVYGVSIHSMDWANSCTIETVTGCHAVRNDQYGVIDINPIMNCGGCNAVVGLAPYHVEVAYESGLETGTSNSPSVLQALTIAAQINLNEIDVSLSNESTADIGLEMFINQKYQERRLPGITTAFGNSAMAQRAARLTRKYRTKPMMRFR